MGTITLCVQRRERAPTIRGRARLAAVAALAAAVTGGCSGFGDITGYGPPLAMLQSSATSTLTFDEAISDATSFEFDVDGDGATDAIFSTDDPAGFGTLAPGGNQLYIDGQGLEGSSSPPVSLRVDFPAGAMDALSFGFALAEPSASFGVTVFVYDEDDEIIGASFTPSAFSAMPGGGTSTLPEGSASVAFEGVARYATISFSNGSRYTIDNFAGNFATGGEVLPPPPPPPPPPTAALEVDGFLPPLGNAVHRIRSTLPLKVRLSLDGAAITSQAALDAALDALGLPAGCPTLALFAASDEATDLGPLVEPNPGTRNPCFRFTVDGQLMYNLRLPPDLIAPGSYSAGVRIGDQLLLPENRAFSVF
jgi:hypothetical protein